MHTGVRHYVSSPPAPSTHFLYKTDGQVERAVGRQLGRGSLAANHPEQGSTSQSQAYKRNDQLKQSLTPSHLLI